MSGCDCALMLEASLGVSQLDSTPLQALFYAKCSERRAFISNGLFHTGMRDVVVVALTAE